jgi:hypothetical protein
MAMALVHGRIGGKAVQVSVAVDIPNPHSFTACENDVQRLVIVGTKQMLTGDDVTGCQHDSPDYSDEKHSN